MSTPTSGAEALEALLVSQNERIARLERLLSSPGALRLEYTGDASPTSTAHPFQIGDTDALNIIADNNEIMARDDGAGANLHLNLEGGDVTVRSRTVKFVQHNYETVTSDASGNFTITFPVAFGSAAHSCIPVLFTGSSYWVTAIARTTTTAVFRMHNSAGIVANTTRAIAWIAVGIHP